jgi:hypothetical protein
MKGLVGESEKDIHRKGRKEQEAALDKVLDAFYSKFNLEKPADRDEALKKFRNAVLAAERNAALISDLNHQFDTLKAASESSGS